jgi:hypothetical protein
MPPAVFLTPLIKLILLRDTCTVLSAARDTATAVSRLPNTPGAFHRLAGAAAVRCGQG